ncbi:MAG: hypothetical protein V3T86_05970 [Planctomycetota bacterium]
MSPTSPIGPTKRYLPVLLLGVALGAAAGVFARGGATEDSASGAPAKKPAAEAVATSYLMGRFVAALSEKPTSAEPSPRWAPLLAKGAETIGCADCHPPPADAKAMAGWNDGVNAAEPFRSDKDFMIDLMEAWVSKLNDDMGDRLRKAVVCRDCHQRDPRR